MSFNKLPAITASFWIMKICATTLGETAGDFISTTLSVGYALSSLLLVAVFLVTLGCQLLATRHYPLLYWLVILATSTAGTTISDYMDRSLGLGYTKGALLLVVLLGLVFFLWRQVEGSLSVDRIHSRRGESLYWTAILFSNTLGTALGDFLADDSGLGFAGGAALIGSALIVTLLVYRFTSLSRVFLFWTAFVLTRPFGATVGDVLTKAPDHGGLGLGTAGASAVLAALLIAVILYTQRSPKARE